MQNNCVELDAIQLQPRVLVDVENISPACKLLGDNYGLPFGVAPMGMCNLAWPGADAAISEQAAKRRLPHCVSTAASTTMEKSYQQANSQAWFQLYAGTDTEQSEEMISRAEAVGYEYLVLTVDTPRLSRRNRDVRNGFQVPFRIGPRQFVDFALHPRWALSTLLGGPPGPMNYRTSKLGKSFQRNDSRGGIDWTYLQELRRRWRGKLIVKGVSSTKDAIEVKALGVDAIYVSNHGGRQLDSAPAAISVLHAIRQAVGEDYPLIFDSGIRSGDDIVRALAMGADFVMLGRPILFALGAGGAAGLNSFFNHLEEDVKSVMAQIGVTNIHQINSAVLAEIQSGNLND